MAQACEKTNQKTDKDYLDLENEYWSMVDYGQGEKTVVEYAADVPTAKYGSGFGRPG